MTATATRTNALDLLHSVHPHHVERIVAGVEAVRPGTVVTVTRTNGGGFYAGLTADATAVVTSMRPDYLYVQRLDGQGAHLGLSAADVTVVPARDLTAEQARAGKRAAEEHAAGLLERAYTSANRLIGAPGTDEALEALREAREDREFAFALQILSEYARRAR